MYVCMCAYVRMFVCAYVRMCVSAYVCVYVCMCAYVHICVCVYMCVCVKTGQIDKVMAVKHWKSCEMVQSWHMELVKYEKHDKVMACKH